MHDGFGKKENCSNRNIFKAKKNFWKYDNYSHDMQFTCSTLLRSSFTSVVKYQTVVFHFQK